SIYRFLKLSKAFDPPFTCLGRFLTDGFRSPPPCDESSPAIIRAVQTWRPFPLAGAAVISMCDVFVILILRFGAGSALVTYWTDNTVAYATDVAPVWPKAT